MGEDGHFASIFPGANELAHLLSTTENTLSAVTAPGASEPRVSLTLSALLAARRVVLAFAGPGKWATFEQVLAWGPDAVLPARALLRQQRVPVDIVACL
jgi:6-phosphogluconolactonase